jgi:hypothetical protein
MFKDYGEWWEWEAKPYTSEIVNAPYNKITKASRRIGPNSWYCISQQIQKPNLQILWQKIASVPVYITEILTLSKKIVRKAKVEAVGGHSWREVATYKWDWKYRTWTFAKCLQRLDILSAN